MIDPVYIQFALAVAALVGVAWMGVDEVLRKPKQKGR